MSPLRRFRVTKCRMRSMESAKLLREKEVNIQDLSSARW